jgi:hypothetical protein
MIRKIRFKNNEEAVSPVVGVMLMLVVTIIIAAVVSGFAGGLVGGTKMAPQASIAIKTGYTSDGNYDISFEHQGGDPILTKECQFITYLTLPNGTVIRHNQTATSPLARGSQAAGVYMYSRGPHLTDPQKYAYPCNPISNVTLPSGWVLGGFTDPNVGENYAWFGKAVWLSGDVARTYHNGYTANFVGLIPLSSTDPYPGTDAVYNDAIAQLKDCVAKNCKLEIKLLHVPSGKYILDKTITLQG